MSSKFKEMTTAVFQPRPRKGISTRSQQAGIDLTVGECQNEFQVPAAVMQRNKRKAIDIHSPTANKLEKIKRSALGCVTNAAEDEKVVGERKQQLKEDNLAAARFIAQASVKANIENKPKNVVVKKPVTRASARHKKTTTTSSSLTSSGSIQRQYAKEGTVTKPKEPLDVVTKPPSRRISNEFDRTGDTLYMSALEFSDQSSRLSMNSTLTEDVSNKRRSSSVSIIKEEDIVETSINVDDSDSSLKLTSSTKHNSTIKWETAIKWERDPPPASVNDFDKETMHDCFQVGDYAADIFDYLKSKEKEFLVKDYIGKQPHISKWMRSLLVDWMVEVQESFELNHETLYLAVKLVDIFLGKSVLSKEKLQLLGAAALFIACKFDERIPPFIDDFLYICDGAYLRNELIDMEKTVFKTIGFNLGIPLSYRFLRRYARVDKIPLPSLTLARYILEFALMDYEIIMLSDSKLACAALYIALKMLKPSNDSIWSETMQFYSGYQLHEFSAEIVVLNDNLNRKQKESLNTIRKKYSHKIFYEVALKPHLSNDALFKNTGVFWRRK